MNPNVRLLKTGNLLDGDRKKDERRRAAIDLSGNIRNLPQIRENPNLIEPCAVLSYVIWADFDPKSSFGDFRIGLYLCGVRREAADPDAGGALAGGVHHAV